MITLTNDYATNFKVKLECAAKGGGRRRDGEKRFFMKYIVLLRIFLPLDKRYPQVLMLVY